MATILERLGLTGVQYNSLKKLSETELSANAIINTLKGTGAAVNRQNGLAAIRELRGVIDTRPYVKSVNYNAQLNPDRLPYALTRQLRQYSYRAELTVLDQDTGETHIVVRNLSSTELLTKQQALDALEDMIFADTSTSGVEYIDAAITEVTQQAPA